jgi:hypothetical protein
VQFLFWEYLFRIFGIVSLQCSIAQQCLNRSFQTKLLINKPYNFQLSLFRSTPRNFFIKSYNIFFGPDRRPQCNRWRGRVASYPQSRSDLATERIYVEDDIVRLIPVTTKVILWTIPFRPNVQVTWKGASGHCT